MATSIPAAIQLAYKLRLGSMKLYADARDAGAPRSAAIAVVFFLCSERRPVRFVTVRASPTSPTAP